MEMSLKALVRFELFDTQVSGKYTGYFSGVRPDHYIEEIGCTVIGQVDFHAGAIDPGETGDAVISYFYWAPFEKLLLPGLVYPIKEGSKVVGQVTVMKRLDS